MHNTALPSAKDCFEGNLAFPVSCQRPGSSLHDRTEPTSAFPYTNLYTPCILSRNANPHTKNEEKFPTTLMETSRLHRQLVDEHGTLITSQLVDRSTLGRLFPFFLALLGTTWAPAAALGGTTTTPSTVILGVDEPKETAERFHHKNAWVSMKVGRTPPAEGE